MLHFQYSEYLLTLAAVPVIILFYILLAKWKKKAEKKIGDASLVKQLTKSFSQKKFNVKFALFIIGFTLCAFAVAGLVEPDGTQKISRKGTDIMIALDVSKSMLAQDIKPSRLERAKQVISRIIDNSREDKIGLVIFAGRAYLQMPMTVDHEAAKMYLASASPDDVPTQGTVISDALKMCYSSFNPKEKTYKSILLISDGEDHDDDAIKVAKKMGKEGIMINTIGIGSPQGAPIMDPQTNSYKTDDKGNTVITKLNQEELSEIAKDGNGLYQLYSTTNQVTDNLKSKLAGIGQQSTVSDSSYDAFKQYFQYILGAALLLLVIESFISEKKKIGKKIIAAMVFCCIISNSLFAQNVKNEIFDGNKAYSKNDYDGAEKSYRNALKIADNNPTAFYNLGNTLYRKNNTDEAVQVYDNAVHNSTDNATKEKAYYNKGVAYQKAKKLPECIDAYKNALMLDPTDEEARQNLQRALKEQKQQQQQQNQKNKKQQQPKQDQKKQDQQNKQDQQKQNDQPKPKPSKLSKQDAEEKLKSLLENEKQLQDKLHKLKEASSAGKPEKDW